MFSGFSSNSYYHYPIFIIEKLNMSPEEKLFVPKVPLEQIMTKQVICVNVEDTLDTLDELFNAKHIHHVPVLDMDNQIVGIISTTDMDQTKWGRSFIMNRDHKDMDQVLLKTYRTVDIMSSSVITMKKTDTMRDAVAKFNEGKIRIIPIVEDKRVVGIVSPMDIINHLLK